MTVEKLERVLWRLRTNRLPDGAHIHIDKLTIAIMREIGTDPRTIRFNVTALETMGWIKKVDHETFLLTGEDLRS